MPDSRDETGPVRKSCDCRLVDIILTRTEISWPLKQTISHNQLDYMKSPSVSGVQAGPADDVVTLLLQDPADDTGCVPVLPASASTTVTGLPDPAMLYTFFAACGICRQETAFTGYCFAWGNPTDQPANSLYLGWPDESPGPGSNRCHGSLI
jgi:hypothetical protein